MRWWCFSLVDCIPSAGGRILVWLNRCMDPTATPTVLPTDTPTAVATVVACVYQLCTSAGDNAADSVVAALTVSLGWLLFGFFLWLAVDGLKTTPEA